MYNLIGSKIRLLFLQYKLNKLKKEIKNKAIQQVNEAIRESHQSNYLRSHAKHCLLTEELIIGLKKEEYQQVEPFIEEIRNEVAALIEENCRKLNFHFEPVVVITNLENTISRAKRVKTNIHESDSLVEKCDVTQHFLRINDEKPVRESWLLKVLSGPNEGRQFLITQNQMTIGRKIDNHIYLPDPKISRYHALIKLEGKNLYLEDLKSTNGTILNDDPLKTKKQLFPGDRIVIGDSTIEVIKLND